MDINLQNDDDCKSVDDLLDTCFGKDRYKKAAYRLRDGVGPVDTLSFVMRSNGILAATLRFWPAVIGGRDGLLLGPIAVSPELQGQGHGISLMRYGLERAKLLGHERVILVGDESYYSKVGFRRDLALNIAIKGQDDESRILGLELREGSLRGLRGTLEKETT